MKTFSEKSKDHIAIILVILIIFVLGYIYGNIKERNVVKSFFGKEIKYDFLSPLLTCPESKYIQNPQNLNLKANLEYLSETGLLNTGINHVSLYFKELNTDYWFGLNEKEVFTPASLIKLPTLIAILKKSESERDLLYQNVKYSLPKIDYHAYYTPKYQIENKKIYSIGQLLEYMIKYSDNNATQILRYILGKDRFINTYNNLGILIKEPNKIQVKDYASFYVSLFNSSYLSKKKSDYALSLLSQGDFTKGLVAGLPNSIKVSHKFGEYQSDLGTKQLHDCGIIYYPNHPYLLCVMTRGKDYPSLEELISNVSKIVYTDINNTYKEIK